MALTLRALRGATTVDVDTADAVHQRVGALVTAMLERNQLSAADVVSVLLTATGDIHSTFPAAAARATGLNDVPMLGAREIDVEGATPRCIRVMMHVGTEHARSELRHVYLEGARDLRHDLPE